MRFSVVLATMTLLAASCGNPNLSSSGRCADTCPAACSVDNDCNTAQGQLCCDFGGDGKACVAASACPRFCSSDSQCDTMSGQACLRTTLLSSLQTCVQPSQSITLCHSDNDCSGSVGQKCCTIYNQPICTDAAVCPSACSSASDCKTGEICCTTVGLVDQTLNVTGLCLGAGQASSCPKQCSTSQDCTGAGQLCCQGVCSTSCPKSCDVSTDCDHQICCKTKAINSVWLGGVTSFSPGPSNNGSCGSQTTCGSFGGSYQVCTSGSQEWFQTSDGQSFFCSANDCTSADTQLQTWCANN